MFRRYHRRSTNIVFVIFRLILSLLMLAVLAGGLYSAYKHFSGLDPFKIDPRMAVLEIIAKGGDISQLISKIPGFKEKLDVGKLDKEDGNSKLDNLTSSFQSQNPASNFQTPTSRSFSFSFAMLTDSHSDNLSLRKALTQIKKDYPTIKFIIGLGDYSEVGTLDELKDAKKELDNGGFRYFLIPGDHDLWDSRNKSLPPNSNFKEVFGLSYQTFSEGNFLFVLLNNSDNYLGWGDDQISWLSDQLEKEREADGIFVFIHEPLYHPSSDHTMGRVENKLKDQATRLIQMFDDRSINQVFAGDIHFFSEYSEPETGLPMVTVGAITSQRNTQAPRFAIAKVYDDGSIEVEDVEIR